MGQYLGYFLYVLLISLVSTLVAIGYFSTPDITVYSENHYKDRILLNSRNIHLRQLDVKLYDNSIAKLHSFPMNKSWIYNKRQNLTICYQSVSKRTVLTLITTLYHSDVRKFIFNNTLKNWGKLKPEILPVLFIADPVILEKSGDLVHRACKLGWVVAIAPYFIKSGYPVLSLMLNYAKWRWKTHWYGYANADMLFTPTLSQVLSIIMSHRHLQSIEFITSQRFNALIPKEAAIKSFKEVYLLANQSQLAYANAIDYFVYRQNSSLLRDMPPFVVGRRGYDNWLVFHALDKGIPSLDITGVSPAVHQSILGLPAWANSHLTKKEDDNYNLDFATGEWWYEKGHVFCIPLLMRHISNLSEVENNELYKIDSGINDTNINRLLQTKAILIEPKGHLTKRGSEFHGKAQWERSDGEATKYVITNRKTLPSQCQMPLYSKASSMFSIAYYIKVILILFSICLGSSI